MASNRKVTPSASKEKGSQGKSEAKYEQIAMIAYLKAEARGFFPGRELEDWLEAEKEVNGNSSKPKH